MGTTGPGGVTTGTGWFLDDQPSARFPVYSRGNVGEIIPNVATPLTATLTTNSFREGFGALFAETGAFRPEELAEPAATGGVFGGYLYFNVTFARTFAARIPGMGVADVDRQMLGAEAERVPPHRRAPGDLSPLLLARTTLGLARWMVRRTAPDLDAARAENRAWLDGLPPEPTDDEVVALAAAVPERFTRNLRGLLEASLGAGIPQSMLERIAGRAEHREPGLLVKAMSGLGTIETAGPALALWRLGRQVAGSAALTAHFDAGVHGVVDRLRADAGGDATRFLDDFDAFLAAHGHRGPNEVELASDTWATAPETALAAVERLRLTDESADPARAALRLEDERERARQRLRAAVPRPLRRLVDRLLAGAGRGAANREQAKGTLVLGLAGVRRALFQAADRLVAGGHLDDRTDLFMATIDELPSLLRDPAVLRDELRARRRRYEELNALVPPFAFEGRMPDPSTWARRGVADESVATPVGAELRGIGVASGVASGVARVVIDAADPRGIEPGEVLVAPITDPAWTPLFLAAAAVVVDVGALQSHAAIVARELGIPAVVSVNGATTRIADGDEVEVDGDRGVVRVLRRAEGS